VGTFHDWVDVLLGLGSIAAVIGSALVGLRGSRHDALEREIAEHGEDISHMQGFLSGYGYRKRD
jgi:hypothetical protein